MTEDTLDHGCLTADGRQSQRAAAICRGTVRMMTGLDYACVPELTLASGLRADIVAVGPGGQITIVEIKSSATDFKTDQKWSGYLEFCDAFYFAVDPEFPADLIPEDQGLIIADRFGGTIVRPSPARQPLAAARRKAMTLRIARVSARRMTAILDPGLKFDPDALIT